MFVYECLMLWVVLVIALLLYAQHYVADPPFIEVNVTACCFISTLVSLFAFSFLNLFFR